MTDAPISRAFVSDIEVRAGGEGRTVTGIVVPFDRTARVSDGGPSYDEMFVQGAFKRTIQHRGDKVKLLSQHNARTNPLGRATLLREDAAGLYGEFYVSRTTAGDEALELLRDGALDSFSVGFSPIKHEKRGRTIVRTEVGLREASLVTFPAYEGALVGGVRAWPDMTDEERAELALLVASHIDLRSTTSLAETSETLGTSPEPAPVEQQDAAISGHSARQTQNRLRLQARKEGGPLS